MIKKVLIISAVLVIVLAGCISASQVNNLRVITEYNPPFNFTDESGMVTGQSTEIVKEIASKLGGTVNIEVLPWLQGYALAQDEDNTVLYSTVRMPLREDLFKWVGPIGFDDDWFYSRRGEDIKVTSLDDARKVKSIAVYKNDRNQLYLSEKGFTNLTVYEDDIECIKSLAGGKVDLWLGPASGLHFIAYRAGVNPAELQAVSYVKRSEYYLAFNKNIPDATVKAWQNALDEMKKSPDSNTMSRYEQIITSYSLPQYSTSNVTPDQVIQLVENTVKDLLSDAPGTISKIESRLAPYLDQTHPELYIYIYDNTCTEVANASNPSLKGRCFRGVPDMAGKLFRDNIVDGALKNGSGWEDYVFTMPGKIGLFHKSAYYQLANGSNGKQYIVCAGLYKTAEE